MTDNAAMQTPINIVSTGELRDLLNSKRPIEFWNVLTDQYFKGENISGSRRVPLNKVGSEVRSTNLPKDTEIVVYCGGPTCPMSRMAAEKLLKLGYGNARAYEGGVEEWKGAGFPIEKVEV